MIQWKLLNVITLVQNQSDNRNLSSMMSWIEGLVFRRALKLFDPNESSFEKVELVMLYLTNWFPLILKSNVMTSYTNHVLYVYICWTLIKLRKWQILILMEINSRFYQTISRVKDNFLKILHCYLSSTNFYFTNAFQQGLN